MQRQAARKNNPEQRKRVGQRTLKKRTSNRKFSVVINRFCIRPTYLYTGYRMIL